MCSSAFTIIHYVLLMALQIGFSVPALLFFGKGSESDVVKISMNEIPNGVAFFVLNTLVSVAGLACVLLIECLGFCKLSRCVFKLMMICFCIAELGLMAWTGYIFSIFVVPLVDFDEKYDDGEIYPIGDNQDLTHTYYWIGTVLTACLLFVILGVIGLGCRVSGENPVNEDDKRNDQIV